MDKHSDLYCLWHNFGGKFIPFKLEKMFKKLFDGIKDKDKSVHEAHYLRMQIMTERNDSRNILSQCHLNSCDFPTNYILNCSIHLKLSTYQVFFQVLL